MFDVDFVVTWVNGADPAFVARKARYLPADRSSAKHPGWEDDRFQNNDELRYCLRSLHNHAPWARTIWLVTDQQTPDFLNLEQALRAKIRIVDHTELFRGHEELLPTFNSLSIETMLWRIEGLADRFVYLNDDMMLVGETKPSTFFFEDGRIRLRGRMVDWSRKDIGGVHSRNKLHGARLAGSDPARLFSSAHVAYPMSRTLMESLFEQHHDAFIRNAAYRFRDRDQFWPISLHDHVALSTGLAVNAGVEDVKLLRDQVAKEETPARLSRLIDKMRDSNVVMTCINALDQIELKLPDIRLRLDGLTGPPAPFEVFASNPAGRAGPNDATHLSGLARVVGRAHHIVRSLLQRTVVALRKPSTD